MPSKNAIEPDTDSSDEEPEPEPEPATSPPRRCVTRNMDPREARRETRGAGIDDMTGEGIMDWLRKHPITEC